MSHTKQSAFTLVELIVVIVILAILATIAFLSFSSQSSSARDSTRLSDINSLKKSFEMYNVSGAGKYPDPDNGKNITFSGGNLWSQGIIGDYAFRLVSKNINKKVTDPLTKKEYAYSLTSNKREFQISADLENPLSANFSDSKLVFLNPFDLTKLNAGGTGTICYINGNYNGLAIKIFTGSLNYILPSPGLILSDTTQASNLVYDSSFGSGGKLLCNGQNFPCVSKFDSSKIFSTGGTSLSSSDITNMMTTIKSAYSGSNIATPAVTQVLNSTGSALVDLGFGLLKNNLGGDIAGASGNSSNNSCATQALWGTGFVVGSPSAPNTPWQSSNPASACYMSCVNGHSGSDCSQLDSNTVLLLHFDNNLVNSGTNPGEVMNINGAAFTGGKFGNSISFNGTNQYLSIQDSNDWNLTGDFTIDFWAYIKTGAGAFGAISQGDGYGSFVLNFATSPLSNAFVMSSAGTTWDNYVNYFNTNTGFDNWTHFAVTRNGNTLRTYANGIVTFSGTTSVVPYDSASVLRIGLYQNPGNSDYRYLKGYMDELRITKGVARWTGNFIPPTVAY